MTIGTHDLNGDLTLREAERILTAQAEQNAGHLREHLSHEKIHVAEHQHEQELARGEERRLGDSMVAHDKDHKASELAVKTALASVQQLADLHAIAHSREHEAHDQRHRDAATAADKAEQSMDKRLASLNEFREQLRDQTRTFASNERLDALSTASDRRMSDLAALVIDKYESNRQRIEALEKGNVKQEGKQLGQGTIVAIIVGAISLVGTVLGIIIVLANLATGTP